ncbi:MAG: hypothetical protein ACO3F2_12730 [Roseiflexaceae bacterium]
MWGSVVSVVYAWERVLVYPAIMFLVVSLIFPPALGWPRLEARTLVPAWLLLVFVPISGVARVGESDMAWLLLLAVLASQTWSDCWSWRWVALGAWIGAAYALAQGCGTLILTRATDCESPAQWFVVAGLVVAMLLWSRRTIAQRMTSVGIGLCVIEVIRVWWL